MSKPLHTLTANELTAISDEVANKLTRLMTQNLAATLQFDLAAAKIQDANSIGSTAAARVVRKNRWNEDAVGFGHIVELARKNLAEAIRESLVAEARTELAAS